jgi:hypothetical protein
MAGRAFLAFILFFLIANPLTYKITRRAFSGIASADGMPTQAGVLVHAFVFVILSKFVMRRFSGYVPGTLHPAMLGGPGAPSSYMALAPHGHKQK